MHMHVYINHIFYFMFPFFETDANRANAKMNKNKPYFSKATTLAQKSLQ